MRGTFTERVMRQVAAEPRPTPARVFTRSLLTLRLGDALAALLTAWRLAFGRAATIPSAIRAQSLVLLLLVAVVGGSGGALATAGALSVLGPVFEPKAPERPPVVTPVDPQPQPGSIAIPRGSRARGRVRRRRSRAAG